MWLSTRLVGITRRVLVPVPTHWQPLRTRGRAALPKTHSQHFMMGCAEEASGEKLKKLYRDVATFGLGQCKDKLTWRGCFREGTGSLHGLGSINGPAVRSWGCIRKELAEV